MGSQLGELECGTTPLVRGDSARSHSSLTLTDSQTPLICYTHAVE